MPPRFLLASGLFVFILAACRQPAPLPASPTAVSPAPTLPDSHTPTSISPTRSQAPTPTSASPTPTRASPTLPNSHTTIPPSSTPTRSSPTPTRSQAPTPTRASPTPTPAPTSSARLLVFHASPERINPGDSVTVYWEVSGTRAELCVLDPYFRLRPFGCQTVPLSGNLTVSTAPRDRYYARFSLRAYDDRAPDAFASYAELAVPINCPDTWMAAGPPPDLGLWDCPAGPARVTAGAAQRFEHGGMYWLEAPDMILVYGDNGGHAHIADLPQNQPDTDPALVPPPGLYQPVRGFGLVWRGLTPLGDMRAALGWAVELEYAYTFSFQCNAAPDLRNEACYVLGPHGLTIWRALGWSETLWP